MKKLFYFSFWIVFTPIILCSSSSNEIIGINNNDDVIIPSIFSIRNLVANLNFDYFLNNITQLNLYLEVDTENEHLNKNIGPFLLYNNSNFYIPYINNKSVDFVILNPFNSITINAHFVFQYIGTSETEEENHILLTLTNSTYLSNDWTPATQYWTSDNGEITWNVNFEYFKHCQNSNYGFYCDNQTFTTTIPSSTLSYTTFSTTPESLSDCETQVQTLQDQKKKETKRKNLFFWLWIGFIVLAVILLLLMFLFCCCWLRERGRLAEYEKEIQRNQNQERTTTRSRNRVDIVHPHMVYPAADQQQQHHHQNLSGGGETTTVVRQRQLPPYRPPQNMQPPRQAAINSQGPIDASSNIVYPRTVVPRYAQAPQPLPRQQPFHQYPSDDDETDAWSVPPNEHVV